MDNNKGKCPYCRKLIDDDAIKCPWCQSDLTYWAENNRKRKRRRCFFWVIVIIIGIFVLIAENENDDKKSSSDTNTKTEQVTENKVVYSSNEENRETHNTIKQTDGYSKGSNNNIVIEEPIDIEKLEVVKDVKDEENIEVDENAAIENNEDEEVSEDIENNNDLTGDKILDIETLKQFTDDIRKTDFDKIKKDKKGIIQKISSFEHKSDYELVILFVIENNKELSRKWQKDGQYFDNQIEFYEAFISGRYKDILKSKNNE